STAGGNGRNVRGLSRSGGRHPNCAAHPLHGQPLGRFAALGRLELATEHFFDTLVVSVDDVTATMAKADDAGYNLRRFSDTQVGISTDETTTDADIAALASVFGVELATSSEPAIDSALTRESEFMTHEIFQTIRSESTMMRYCRRLADRDLALDRTMIPLGSCTMKLNAAAE